VAIAAITASAAAGVTLQTVSSSLKVLSVDGGVFAKDNTREYDPERGWYFTVKLTPRAPGGSLIYSTRQLPVHPSDPTHCP
jgi:hypothetical protein